MTFGTFENKYIITGTIETIDPIHIGTANEGLDPTQVDDPVIKDASGKPIIPGSSLKGVIRSTFETVMRGIGEEVCDVFEQKKDVCITDEFLKEIAGRGMSPEVQAKLIYEKSCCVCRLFGGRGFASKLQFKDCTFIGDKCIYEYRDGVGIDRETGAAKQGVKYDYEIVPKGSKFRFYMTADNLDSSTDSNQKKYLDYLIRLLESGELCIGGKTSRGLGRIKLIGTDIKEITLDSLKADLGF